MHTVIIHAGFRASHAMTVFHLTGESHQRLDDTVVVLLNYLVDEALIVGGGTARVTHHHSLGLTAYLANGMLHEVVYNHGCLAQHDKEFLFSSP